MVLTNDIIFKNVFDYKIIYVFSVNDNAHNGLVKIGDATLHTCSNIDQLTPNCKQLNQAALKRIKSYTNTVGVSPELLHTELAIKEIHKQDGTVTIKAFRDYEVHKVLENSNIKKETIDKTTGREWFRIDKDTAIEAIKAVKQGYQNIGNVSNLKLNHTPIIFRPEQKDAIEYTVKHFKKNDKMLWNAKMRFGKTLSALEVIKECNFKKTIIITHRPVVNEGWYEDFKKIFYNTDYIYGSRNNGYTVDELNKINKPYVYFASIQYLRRSEIVGGVNDKNEEIFKTLWDCVIVDEAHEGTKTPLGDDTVKAIFKENLKKTKLLALSGTPFNILDEYDDSAIFTWDYIMEQDQKNKWPIENFGDSNPYEELPELRIYTYDLGDLLNNKSYINIEDKAFNFQEFFRTWTGNYKIDFEDIPLDQKIGDFVHEKDVFSFLNLITKKDDNNCYPFSKEEYRELFRHSLWKVPGIREAKALKELMLKHPVFGNGQFNIINVAGNDDEEAANALTSVRNAIKRADEMGTYTITLSCGKLTTGVTIKEWSAVFMLSGSSSTKAANYLQTIFRVQSPCNKNGKIKNVAYVFDFAPDRTLKMVAESVSISSKAGKTKYSDKIILGKFLNYCPVISVYGSQMKEYKVDRLLQQLKKAYADKVVSNGFADKNLYNDELMKLDKIEIEEFDKLKEIVGKQDKNSTNDKLKMNDQGLTDEEYEQLEKINSKKKRELTEEEKKFLKEMKEKRKLRKNAISILNGISIRMPLLIYGANVPYEEEITLDKFINEVDDSSWNEFMPSGVTKDVFSRFKKYYDEDVFISAGRKIRNIALEADNLTPTERVIKISSLFSGFKNPDKETVLTPWNIVNMHISEALGGYDFFGFDHETLLDAPRFVNNGNKTLETVCNPSCNILEIGSKTGLYSLYITYSIFRTKCKMKKLNELSLEDQNKLWIDTVQKNIFVICKTPMAKQITQRTLMGYKKVKINAHYFDDLNNQIKNKSSQFIERVLKSNYWKKGNTGNMKFDAVVGNPPYQEENDGDNNSKKSIYNYFMDVSMQLSNKVTLIHPARFLFNVGDTPKAWNKKILNDEHFKVVNYWSNSMDVFPTVKITGGIAISYWDKDSADKPIILFSPHDELNSIKNKTLEISKDSLTSIITNRGLYKYSDLVYKEFPEEMKKASDRRIAPSAFERIPKLFTEEKPNDGNDYVQLIGNANKERCIRWFRKDYISNNNNLDKYKVLVPKANGSPAIGEGKITPIIGTPLIAYPNVGFTETYISIGATNSLYEAKAILKYIKTKFARALLGAMKVTQNNAKDTWQFVPLQDFSEKSDIIWSQSVEQIDSQLFKKYNLNDKEINFIEKNIQEMN